MPWSHAFTIHASNVLSFTGMHKEIVERAPFGGVDDDVGCWNGLQLTMIFR